MTRTASVHQTIATNLTLDINTFYDRANSHGHMGCYMGMDELADLLSPIPGGHDLDASSRDAERGTDFRVQSTNSHFKIVYPLGINGWTSFMSKAPW